MSRKKYLPFIAALFSFALIASACNPDDPESPGSPGAEDTETGAAGGEACGAEIISAAGAGGAAAAGTAELVRARLAGAAQAGDTVKIAYQGPITGDYQALGENMVRGVQVAIEELNASGELDVTLELLELDSQADPAQAPALANQAAADPAVIAVVGPTFSGESAASGPIYEEAGLPFISPSATGVDLATNGWKFWFRTVATDAVQGPAAAQFIAENLGATKVAIIDDASEFGLGLANQVETSLTEAGVEIVAREGIEAGGTDFSTVVGTVVQSGAEAVFFGGYYPEAGLLRKQLVENGGEDITFVSDDGTFDPEFINIAGADEAEGCFVTFPGSDPSAVSEEFRTAFADATGGEEPGAYSVEAYQVALLIGEALKSGATDRQGVRDFVADFDGEIFGKHIQFLPTGDSAEQTFYVYQVQGGEWKQVEEIQGDVDAGGTTGEPTEAESPSETASPSETES